MSQHTPQLIIQDDVDGPRLRIVQMCKECDCIISVLDIDVSDLPADFDAGVLGAVDGEAWLKHAKGEA